MFASVKAIFVIIYLLINYSKIISVQCDTHSVGTHTYADRVLHTTLFSKDSYIPRNYSLAFKYIHSMYRGQLVYLQVDINCKSTGHLNRRERVGPQEADIIKGNIELINCKNVTIVAEAYAFGGNSSPLIYDTVSRSSFHGKVFAPKTYAMIYPHNSSKISVRKMSKGHRQPGDKLLYFERKSARVNGTEFAHLDFDFNIDKHGKFITYVEISINSPTTVVYWKDRYLIWHEFSAALYDFFQHSFAANVTIYGYDSFDRPSTYESISMYL